MKPANAMLAAVAVAMCGCQWFERRAINGSIESAFHEINTPGTGVTKLADDLYTYKWFGYRTAFLTTSEGVIVFDPLNADAATELSAEIKKVAPNPTIRYVIYSHDHADHSEGATRLGGTPVIVSHAIAAKKIAARADPEIAAPTETFDDARKDITLGGVTVQLLHTPGAHTEGLIAAYVPHRKTLYAVDIVAVHMVPPFGSPFNSYHGVVAALGTLQKLDFQTLIPGHGPTGTKADLSAWLTMLGDMKTSLETAAKANGMAPMRGNAKAIKHPKVGQVLFAALDDLKPKYGSWQGWDHNALQALQWVFLYGIYMNE